MPGVQKSVLSQVQSTRSLFQRLHWKNRKLQPVSPPKPPKPPASTSRSFPSSLTRKSATESSRSPDEYVHFQNLELPAVREYIHEENQYARQLVQGYQQSGLLETITRELRYLDTPSPHLGVPPPLLDRSSDGFEYWMTEDGEHYRRKWTDSRDAPSVADVRAHSKDAGELVFSPGWLRGRFLGSIHASPCGKYVAYVEHAANQDAGTLTIRALSPSAEYPVVSRIPKVIHFVWSQCSQAIVYNTMNERLRPDEARVCYWRTKQDYSLWKEPDEGFFVDVSSTKDRSYLSVNINSRTSSEVHVLPSQLPLPPSPSQQSSLSPLSLRCIQPRRPGVEYFLDHHQERFYVVSNAFDPEHLDFTLATTPASTLSVSHWTPVTNLPPNNHLEDVDLFRSHAVLYTRHRQTGAQRIWCRRWADGHLQQVPLPADVGTITPGINRDWYADRFRFIWRGLGVREMVVEYPFDGGQVHVLRKVGIQGVDWEQFAAKRVLIKSQDGTKVPVTLQYHKLLEKKLEALLEGQGDVSGVTTIDPSLLDWRNLDNGKSERLLASDSPPPKSNDVPILLTGYGAYGISTDPSYDVTYLPLLLRHWVLATAHVRGGGELGRRWYLQGKHHRKQNTFHDFMAVSEAFHRHISGRVWLCASGFSAGGLLVANALQQGWNKVQQRESTEHLLRAALLHVPFVDPIAAMMDSDMPLTTMEYEEWGNPMDNEQDYQIMLEYAPFENVPFDTPKSASSSNRPPLAPSVFVSTGLQDNRVSYWQPLKYVARLRSRLTSVYGQPMRLDRDPVLALVVREEGGHYDDSMEATPEETAFRLCFLLAEVEKGRRHEQQKGEEKETCQSQ